MSAPDDVIKPSQPPLSHLAEARGGGTSWKRPALVAGLAIAALVGIVWVFSIEPTAVPEAVADRPEPAPPQAASAAGSATASADAPAAPFAAITRQQARERAEENLRAFVEAQLALNERMQPEAWAEEAVREANAAAKRGDAAFVEEAFDEAAAAYAEALERTQAIELEGERRYDVAIQGGIEALDARDERGAMQAFAEALLVRPGDEAALKGQSRTERLPEVISLMRDARNFELSESWAEALSTYDEIAQLDPDTQGLDALRAETARLRNAARVRELLSSAFQALDGRRYDAARSAFQQVLALDPGNDVATGGLQDVAAKSELSVIARRQRDGEQAEAREDWQAALDLYDSVLAIDPNIEFAKLGRTRVRQLQQAEAVLRQIQAQPDKLSLPKRFAEANQIIERANAIETQAPGFMALRERVADIVASYAKPVQVTLVSDEATEVLLSSVGRLGRFSNKTLELRPGEYTVVGSRDGCRDVRQNFVVRPGMAPVEIRCEEQLR